MVIICDPGDIDCPSLCDSAMVIINVDPDEPCTAPQFSVDTLYCDVVQDSLFNGCVQVIFSGTDYEITVLEQPENGTVTLTADDCFIYTPDPSFEGLDTFSLVVCNTDPECTDLDLCDTLIVIKDVYGDIRIPDVITPNGDGPNDYFVIKGLDKYPDNSLQVFNRWGNKVYDDRGYGNDWDGTYNGENVPDGTYYYVLTINHPKFPDPFVGFLVIHR
jgi:gliding motility-associated-like protein